MTSNDIVAKIRAEKNSNIDTLILEASNVEISNNIGLIIPVGTTLERGTTSRKGTIRYNSTDTAFEGYDGTTWGTLGGVKDVAQTTFIRAETSPGVNNKQLDFITDNTQRMQIDSNGDLKFGDISNQDIKFSINYYSGDVSGQNILPKTTNTYSLGNSTNKWKELYLDNSGIIIGNNASITKDINNSIVLNNDDGNFKITGNLSITGNLTIPGQNIQAGGQLISQSHIIGTPIGIDGSGNQGREEALFTSIDVKDNSIFRGDLSVNKILNVQGLINFYNNLDSSSSSTGALVVTGGVGIGKNLNVGGTFTSTIESVLDIDSTLTSQNVFQPLVPPGAVMSFATKGAPQGWLECSGQMVSRSTYANLFAVIGTTWGGDDDIDEFEIPNLNNGQFIRGGGMDAIYYTHKTAGPLNLNITTVDNGSHAHGSSMEIGKSGTTTATNVGFRPRWERRESDGGHYGTVIGNNGVHNHAVNVTGWDTETVPKHVILLYCIKY